MSDLVRHHIVGFLTRRLICLQVAEEECGVAAANDMDQEPYFVDFLREAPEATGTVVLNITCSCIQIAKKNPLRGWRGGVESVLNLYG